MLHRHKCKCKTIKLLEKNRAVKLDQAGDEILRYDTKKKYLLKKKIKSTSLIFQNFELCHKKKKTRNVNLQNRRKYLQIIKLVSDSIQNKELLQIMQFKNGQRTRMDVSLKKKKTHI